MELLTGKEEFTLAGEGAGITVFDYWAWSFSDLYDNAMRGIMAEFLVFSSFNRRITPPRICGRIGHLMM